MTHFQRPFTIALTTLTLAFVLLFAAGCWRYGGPTGLLHRVQSEVNAMPPNPHPDFVPTPLPVAEGVGDSAITIAGVASVEPQIIQIAQAAGETQAITVTVPTPTASLTTSTTVSAASPTPSPFPTLPSPTPPPPTPVPPPIHQPAAPAVRLTGFSHQWQTWNNCGPATLAMNLSYYGSPLTQTDIGNILRSHEDDKNVLPSEMMEFARQQGYHASIFVNGDAERMKMLLSNGIPAIIETWLEEDPNDGMGHYRMLTGYDDARRVWIAFDSYVSHNLLNPNKNAAYEGIYLTYDHVAQMWPVFNRTYLLIYTEQQRPIVESILGTDMDTAAMWQRSYMTAHAALAQNSNDSFAWFNLGSTLTALGNYTDAAQAFDQARQIGLPWRMLWYQFGPFAAYAQVGRYEEVLALADATIQTTQSVEELYYWRGVALSALGDVAGARQSWQAALTLNPRYVAAQQALQ